MIRVVVAAEWRLYRAALVAMLSRGEKIEVLAESASHRDAFATARRIRPDVLLLDIDDGHGRGSLETITELISRSPGCAVVLLVSADRVGWLQRLMAAGVSAVLGKDTSPAHLLDALGKIAAGERVLDVQLARTAALLVQSPFTRREADVLRVAADGASAAEIARTLALNPATVRNHLARIIDKTGARTRVDAVRIAEEHGWL